MHRRCITLISSLLTLSGWVRKPLNYLKVRTGMYRYILLRTNMEFLYCPVPSRTGTYWYVPVHTILPNPVQGYRIPDARNSINSCPRPKQEYSTSKSILFRVPWPRKWVSQFRALPPKHHYKAHLYSGVISVCQVVNSWSAVKVWSHNEAFHHCLRSFYLSQLSPLSPD